MEEIIIDGVDVSQCEYLHQNVICGKFCTHCEQNPNCYYKQLKQKEKEIEQYKQSKQASYEEMQRRWNEVELKNRELEKEIEILEKINKENQEKIKRQNELLAEDGIAKQYGDEALFFELEDYKEAIDKIKEYCNKYPQNSIGFKKNILQIINEVEE